MRDYVSRYRLLLDRRVGRIVDSLAQGDLDAAMDAVLSLKAASAMVGACETTELAQNLKQSLGVGDVPRAKATASLLPRATRRLDVVLGEFLADQLGDLDEATIRQTTPSGTPPHAQCG